MLSSLQVSDHSHVELRTAVQRSTIYKDLRQMIWRDLHRRSLAQSAVQDTMHPYGFLIGEIREA